MKINMDDFRVIPGYERYLASRFGHIHVRENLNMLAEMFSNGYMYVRLEDNFIRTRHSRRKNQAGVMIKLGGKRTYKLFRVHQLVGLAWLDNPENKPIVNHLDGNGMNNHISNLEYATESENSQHAYDNGLNQCGSACRIRDYDTGEVLHFPTISSAKHHMGVPINTMTSQLTPARFGVLLVGKYEFRLDGDDRPWFYETHTRKVEARYWITVEYPDGSKKELFTLEDIKNIFQIPTNSDSIPTIIEKLAIKHPELKFNVRDSADEDIYADIRAYQRKKKAKVWCYDLEMKKEFVFDNVNEAAVFFGVNDVRMRTLLMNIRAWRERYLFAFHRDTEKIRLLKGMHDVDVGPERNSSNCGNVSETDDNTTACSKETSTPSE